MTSAQRGHVEITDGGRLTWFANPGRPMRGFCERCGSSLFWDAPERDTLTIAAGTLDPPTHLRTHAHIYWAHAGDYEVVTDDLPRHPAAAPPNDVLPPQGETSRSV
jgi:hypothetical protein